MKCQMPGCDKKSVKKINKSGIFSGINIEDFSISVCSNHSVQDVNEYLTGMCNKEAISLQAINPFLDISKSNRLNTSCI